MAVTFFLSLILLPVSAVLLVARRNNGTGVRCGIIGTLFGLLFFWCWFGVQSKGRAEWYELALLLFSHPMVVLFLAAGLGLTIANAVVWHREENGGFW